MRTLPWTRLISITRLVATWKIPRVRREALLPWSMNFGEEVPIGLCRHHPQQSCRHRHSRQGAEDFRQSHARHESAQTILVVDDESRILNSIAGFFRAVGYN